MRTKSTAKSKSAPPMKFCNNQKSMLGRFWADIGGYIACSCAKVLRQRRVFLFGGARYHHCG